MADRHKPVHGGDLPPILSNIRTIADLERQEIHERSTMERITDTVTAVAGSPIFVIAHVAWFAIWIGVALASDDAVDPYPFNLLSLLVSLEAIVLTGLMLMSQDRLRRQANRRAHLDLQVNLLAEQELTAILRMVWQLCRQAGIEKPISDPRIQEMLGQTDIHKLARDLDREFAEEPAGHIPGGRK